MENKIKIEELGLNEGSVFEDVIFEGNFMRIAQIFDNHEPLIFKIESENKNLFIPDSGNISYIIFSDENKTIKKPVIDFSEELKNQTEKQNADVKKNKVQQPNDKFRESSEKIISVLVNTLGEDEAIKILNSFFDVMKG